MTRPRRTCPHVASSAHARPPSGRRRVIALTFVALAALVAASISTPPSVAAPAAQEGPLRVRVGVYLLSVSDLDIGADSYTMDFYLTLSCDRPCDPGRFEFVNGRATSTSLQDDLPQYKVYRIVAELGTIFNLRSFPFDSHALSLSIEDELLPASALVYEVDAARSGVEDDLIAAGWNVSHGWRAQVQARRNPVFDEPYSRYTFAVTIDRPLQYSILKMILPGLMIVAVGLLSLLISVRFILERLSVAGSALLGAILYYLEATQDIPPLPYLTYAARFMLINYLALSLTLASAVALIVLEQRNLDLLIRNVRLLALRTIPLAWVALQVANAMVLAF